MAPLAKHIGGAAHEDHFILSKLIMERRKNKLCGFNISRYALNIAIDTLVLA